MLTRELTDRERQTIRRLVKTMCASYDADYGCLPLGTDCYMFGKTYTCGAMCRWFKNAVLPLDPELERVFTGGITPDTKPCAVCGKAFPINGRQSYCSDKCAKTGRRKSYAANSRAYRARRHERHQLAQEKDRNINAYGNEKTATNTKGQEDIMQWKI